MKYWYLLMFLFFSGCTTLNNQTLKEQSNVKKLWVRLTVYWSEGEGADYWTKKRKSATGCQLRENHSVAVDPKIIPYHSKLYSPLLDMEWVAVDTGSAIIKRTASKKDGTNYPVVDVYFRKRKDALNFARNYPKHIEIEVY